MKCEIDTLVGNNIWSLTSLPPGKKALVLNRSIGLIEI